MAMSQETRKKLFACMSALLLINVHPIRAVLLSEADDATEALLRELQVSVQQEMQRKDRQGDDRFPGSGFFNHGEPTCDQLHTSFAEEVTSAKSAWYEIKDKLESASVFELVGQAKRMRAIGRAMEKGSDGNCSWVSCGVDSEFKTSDCGNSFADLRELMNDVRMKLPCNRKFEETHSENVVESMGILFGDCTTTSPLDTATDAAVADVTSLAVVGKGANSLMDVTAHSTDGKSTVLFTIAMGFLFLFYVSFVTFMWFACFVSGFTGFLGLFGCFVSQIRSLFGGEKVSFFDCWENWFNKVKTSSICQTATLASLASLPIGMVLR